MKARVLGSSGPQVSSLGLGCMGENELLLRDATRADYCAVAKKEFDGIRGLVGDYLGALEKAYAVPSVPEPK